MVVVAFLAAACSNTNKTQEVSVVKRPVQAVAETLSHNQVENTGNAGQNFAPLPAVSDKTKFASRDYGVSGSPRVTKSKRVKKGGGSYKVGKPYTIRGKRYVPREDPDYSKTGLASWYGPNFHGRLTANGEIYDQYGLSAAHPTMPLPSYAKVTNLENGSSVTVRVNDRGPYAHNRIIDLSSRAAQLLGYTKQGVAKVRVEYVGKARLDGLDEEFLVASYDPGSLNPATIPPNPGGTILVADAGPTQNRTTLQAFDRAGFAPPLPQFRPYTSDGGVPVDITALNTPRPGGLVSGFAKDNKTTSKALDAIASQFDALPQIATPQNGMADIQFVTVGPFADETKLLEAETIMLGLGPATVEFSDGKRLVRAMIPMEGFSKAATRLQAKNIFSLQKLD